MKFMDRLGSAFVITILSLLSGLVLGTWYAIAYYASPVFFKWCLWLIPPVAFIAMFIGLTWRYGKDGTK